MIDIERLRKRAGFPIDDASHDEDLELAGEQALMLCETFCDRFFEKKSQTEQIWRQSGHFVVKRYPVESVTSITDTNGAVIDLARYGVQEEAGIIHRIGGASPFKIVYVGGYDPLPPDLEYAILGAFDAVWASTPGWGAAAGSIAEQVQKISVVGVGSIDFGTGGTTSGGSSGSSAESQPWGVLPVTVTSVLQRYMRHTVIGGG